MMKGSSLENDEMFDVDDIKQGNREAEMASHKIRVLIFVDRFLRGGIQTLIWNIAVLIDRNRFDVMFLTLDDGSEIYPMEADLMKMGFKVERLKGVWLNNPIDYVKYYHELHRFFDSHTRFDVVHMHSSSKNYPFLQVAAKHEVPIRIAHSHNTDYQTKSNLKKRFGAILSLGVRKYANHWFACSAEAGKWMFGRSFSSSDKSLIIKNALPLDRYQFSDEIRTRIRKELHIEDDALVTINVARLSWQKNHFFLLSVFAKLLEIREKSVLLLVGEGELMDALQKQARKLGIDGKVQFLGFRNDVLHLLMASDVMVMTSFHEGLPYAAIEAQATGLPCVFSSSISRESLILPTSLSISLDEEPEKWADIIVGLPGSYNRSLAGDALREHGFDLAQEVRRLESVYSGKSLDTQGSSLRATDE